MMKKILHITGIICFILICFSCENEREDVRFKKQVDYTIYDYIVAKKDTFSSFLKIIEKGGLSKILSAYNPEDNGYTLFLPDNNAIDEFIQEGGKYSSLDDMLNDADYVAAFCRYHVISKGYVTDGFPFGAFPSYTLSKDQLTVSFISETDTSYYKINNQAPVKRSNIEVANGYIHIISKALKPIVFTTYNWLEQNSGYSIFKAAVDTTGFAINMNVNVKQNYYATPFTLLLEHDSVFNKRKIYTIDDLIKKISPGNSDFTSTSNPLYNFVGYHMLVGSKFLNNLEGFSTNYNTYSDIPVNISDKDLFLAINYERENFDTIIVNNKTTIINYIGFNYDASNVLTQSGVIHFIDQIMTQKSPVPATQSYSFREEPLFNELREEPAAHIIEDSSALKFVSYSGADLFFISGETSSTAWEDDYLLIDGSFTISYKIPPLIQGLYEVYLRAESTSNMNAVIQLYIDGINVGGLINLTTGGTSWDTYRRINPANTAEEGPIGKFDFVKYEGHTITINSLIPGRLLWDGIYFKPVNK